MAMANYDLLTYDRMSIQGTNDSTSIEERTLILLKALRAIKSGDAEKEFPFFKLETFRKQDEAVF
jgi:hypothetical protein